MNDVVFDEATFIAHAESANTDEFWDLLTQPTKLEERALRAYFGDGRYQRLHTKALRAFSATGLDQPEGNVVVLPGFLGSELSSAGHGGDAAQIWIRVTEIMAGALGRLELDEDGRSSPASTPRSTRPGS